MIEQTPEQDEHDTNVLAEGVRQGVAQGINDAKGKWRNWFNDKRLLIIYLVVILILAVVLTYVTVYVKSLHNAQRDIKQSQDQINQGQRQIEVNQRAVKANCEAQNASAQKFNTFIDQAIANANNTTGLTPEQKQAAIDRYAPLHEAILDCSHLAN